MDPPQWTVAAFYDAHAPRYEAKFLHPLVRGYRRREEAAITAALDAWIPAGGSVLELGCGTGVFTDALARRAGTVTAVDFSSGMLDQLARRLQRAGIVNVCMHRADVEAALPEGLFDAVVGIGLLEYIHAPDVLLARVREALGPGGVAVFTAPRLSLGGALYFALSVARKKVAVRLYRPRALAHLARRAGLEVLALRAAGRDRALPPAVGTILVARRPTAG